MLVQRAKLQTCLHGMAGNGQYPEVDAPSGGATGVQGPLLCYHSPRDKGCHGIAPCTDTPHAQTYITYTQEDIHRIVSSDD